MRRSRRPLASLLSLLWGLALCQASPAWAGAFTVNPTRIMFSPNTRSTLLRLHNQSPEALRFQLSVFAWGQSPDGEMQLTPTEDIIVFPTLLTLAPDDTRNIRVGPATPFAAIEKSFRIFVEVLPPLASPKSEPPGIQVLTRMGIPVFLQPAAVMQNGHLERMTVRQGHLSFQVKNTGNVHFVEQAIRLRGFGSAEQRLFEHQLAGWYVLAGGIRTHELDLPREACAKIRALAVEVQTEWGTLQERFDVPSGSCGQ
jgi:fimbrial chaperone protein